jgi:SecD/SecF fusion protein
MAHLIFDWWLKRGKDIKFTTRISHNNFANLNIQFVNKRKYAYILSGTLAIIGLISIFTKDLITVWISAADILTDPI